LLLLIAGASRLAWDSAMSKQSRARVAAKEAHHAAPFLSPNPFLAPWGTLLAGAIVVFAAWMAYHNSFSGPFIFDDLSAITSNPSIKHIGNALSPPASSTAGGRPLLNLTFAVNYALGGMNVWGYHAVNLLVHMLAGLTLFGIVRRTLLRPAVAGLPPSPRLRRTGLRAGPVPLNFEKDATSLALAVAGIWVVHPVQTEAVTCISQRAESLMGLFYLLTLYCFIRGAENCRSGFTPDASGINPDLQSGRGSLPNPAFQLFSLSVFWLPASVLACLLGAMSKENIVTAPVMVLLYDRTFVAGSFREAWRLRWRYYFGLAGTWLLLARLMTSLGQRHVGFGQGVTWWNYALSSCRSVVLYLKLAVWPHPLVFDYGDHIVQHATEVVPYALILVALLAAVALALRHWPALGFLGAWFFVILAPTSSVVPVALQPMAEHRLYLSLAAAVIMAVLGLYAWLGRRSAIVFAVAAVGLGALSVQRNQDYKSELNIWSDTVAKSPGNERAHVNLGNAFEQSGRVPEAIAQYETALRIKPDYAEAHNNLGLVLSEIAGRLPDAIAEYETALRIKPDYAEPLYNLGNTFLNLPGRLPDAIAQYEAALRIKPDLIEAHNNLGKALLNMPGRLPEAVAQFQAVLWIDPDHVNAHSGLGAAFVQEGHLADALAQFKETVRITPEAPEAHNNFGYVLARLGRLPEAIEQYELALRLKPDFTDARNNLELARKTMAQQTR
jgi:tetratricopeptide (TPR) repeat protein